MRTLILATAVAAAMTLPAIAQDTTAPAAITESKAPDVTTDSPAPVAPVKPMVSTEQTAPSLMLTADEAKAWVGKPVYSSDGKNLGDVVAFNRSEDNTVTEMNADIGGFLGFGEHRISVTPEQFTLKTDRVVLDLTSTQAKALPKIAK
jgi:hypothetical protein